MSRGRTRQGSRVHAMRSFSRELWLDRLLQWAVSGLQVMSPELCSDAAAHRLCASGRLQAVPAKRGVL